MLASLKKYGAIAKEKPQINQGFLSPAEPHREVNFGAGGKFGTEVAERYGEGSIMLAFLGKESRKTVKTMKNYGGSKTLRIRAP